MYRNLFAAEVSLTQKTFVLMNKNVFLNTAERSTH
jgi:hypothetical protein